MAQQVSIYYHCLLVVQVVWVMTLGIAFGLTAALLSIMIGEYLGDKPIPSDFKIWLVSITIFSWLMCAVVSDLKRKS